MNFCLFFYLYVTLSIPIHSIYHSFYLSIYQLYLSIHSIYPSIYLSIWWWYYLHMFWCLGLQCQVPLSIYLSIFLSMFLYPTLFQFHSWTSTQDVKEVKEKKWIKFDPPPFPNPFYVTYFLTWPCRKFFQSENRNKRMLFLHCTSEDRNV